jgi:hypothetical protein
MSVNPIAGVSCCRSCHKRRYVHFDEAYVSIKPTYPTKVKKIIVISIYLFLSSVWPTSPSFSLDSECSCWIIKFIFSSTRSQLSTDIGSGHMYLFFICRIKINVLTYTWIVIELTLVDMGKGHNAMYCQGNTVRIEDSWPNVTVHAHGVLVTVGRPDYLG